MLNETGSLKLPKRGWAQPNFDLRTSGPLRPVRPYFCSMTQTPFHGSQGGSSR
jgi:hypothetical protein